MSGDVLVLSKYHAGGVKRVTEVLHRKGLRAVLVSSEADDPDARCDAYVPIDWDTATMDDLTAAVAAEGVQPVAVVNLVEALQTWQLRISREYDLPGNEPSREVLLSKVRVREAMDALGIGGSVRHRGGRVDSRHWTDGIDFYPAIVKPSRYSGASRLVRLVADQTALCAHLDRIRDVDGADAEVIVESYVDGIEFCVDGPVIEHTYRPLLACEKTDYDYERHHDAGVLLSPPVGEGVRAAVPRLAERIGVLCRSLGLRSGWLHVEGRATAAGEVELIEINARYGGGVHPPAIRRVFGIDPVTAVVSAALPGGWTLPPSVDALAWAHHEQLGLLNIETHELGRVAPGATAADLLAIDGVVAAIVNDRLTATSHDVENFFAFVLLAGEETALPLMAKRVLAAISKSTTGTDIHG